MWDSRFSRKQVNSISGPLNSVLDFLAGLFHSGLEWNTIAQVIDLLSQSTTTPLMVFRWKSALMFSVLKGVFNERAPVPRYAFIWGVQKVIADLSALDMPEYLNDKMLTLKLTMLIGLKSFFRALEVCFLNIDFLIKHPVDYSCHLSKITETARQGKLRPPVELTQFSDKNLSGCHRKDSTWREQSPGERMKDKFYQALVNLLAPRQFLDRFLRFCHCLGLILSF